MRAVLLSAGAALAIALALLFVLAARPIGRGPRQASTAARGLAGGDLDQTIDIREE
jgi:hypothetical protein